MAILIWPARPSPIHYAEFYVEGKGLKLIQSNNLGDGDKGLAGQTMATFTILANIKSTKRFCNTMYM